MAANFAQPDQLCLTADGFACCRHVFRPHPMLAVMSLAALDRAAMARSDQAEVTQGNGLNVTVRLGELERWKHNVDKGS